MLAERFPDFNCPLSDAAVRRRGEVAGQRGRENSYDNDVPGRIRHEFAPSLLALTNGLMPYDNTQTSYSGSADDAALNASVSRYASDPSAVNYMRHYYTPTGDLHIPVIMLHATRDPIVPIFHEDMYAVAVANAGASQYLLRRRVDEFGHTGVSDAHVEAAFFAMVEWGHSGEKPLN